MTNSHILYLKNLKLTAFCAFFLATFLFAQLSFGQEKEKTETEKKFEPKEIILEHIGDSHVWPVFGKISMPLPIIIYTSIN